MGTARSAEAVGGDCVHYAAGRRRSVPPAEARRVAETSGGFVWIGLWQAGHREIAGVADQFALPALAVEEAITAHQRPKLEEFDDIAFLVLKPVRYVNHDEVVDVGEISLFLGRDFVVTVRHGESDVLGRVRRELAEPDPERPDFGPTTVLYLAAHHIVDDYLDATERIVVDVDDIEAQVFGPGEQDHSERIYKLKRELAEFRRAVAPLLRPLEDLAGGNVAHVDPGAAHHFRGVLENALRVADEVEGLDRLLTDILQANVARVTVGQSNIALRQNEDVRRISAWAAIALVPTAIAGIYGMNFDTMPELRWRYGYFGVLAVIAVACWVLHRLFRRNGWL
ncbi:MAG TPA: magnesium and cobalt transport protein CorA [Pseudonocardiaceae bacterium]